MKPKLEILRMFCDGGARGNPGPGAIGVVIKDKNGKTIKKISKTIGQTTNNTAEYKAVIAGLRWIKDNLYSEEKSFKKISVFLDSNLLVNQLNGVFKVKNKNLQTLILETRKLESSLMLTNKDTSRLLLKESENEISYTYIPREKNHQADLLVNQALDKSFN